MTTTSSQDPALVVGLSHSAASAAAVRWALQEGARSSCPVRVVHVDDAAEHSDTALGRDEADVAQAQQVLFGRVGDAMQDLGGDLEDVTVSVARMRGRLEDELTKAATGARALVVGQPGRCRHKGLENRLRAHVECPVVVVPG